MIAIINYGVGNLFSLTSSLDYLNIDNIITSDYSQIRRADRLILPGVGAFPDAYDMLQHFDLVRMICQEAKDAKPILGICLGMQLLFERSYEYGSCPGLGLIPGEICPLSEDLSGNLKVPHIGWNSLKFTKENPLLRNNKEGDYVYYVHSYYAKGCDKSTIATSEYGVDITGAVCRGNVYGTQFHPEKSGEAGLNILRAFASL